jgi:hypothetical protein
MYKNEIKLNLDRMEDPIYFVQGQEFQLKNRAHTISLSTSNIRSITSSKYQLNIKYLIDEDN